MLILEALLLCLLGACLSEEVWDPTDPRCEERRQELLQNSDCLYLNEAYGWINRTLYG